jgi:formate C-acetyltransferase
VVNGLVLKIGITGLIKRLEERAEDDSLTQKQRDFLDAAIKQWQAALRYAQRYVAFYRELAEKESDENQRREYNEIADRMEKVPAYPAEGFIEALQSMWFMYLCINAEDISGHTLGRIDQTLYPYYKKDIESGVLGEEEAEEYFYDSG